MIRFPLSRCLVHGALLLCLLALPFMASGEDLPGIETLQAELDALEGALDGQALPAARQRAIRDDLEQTVRHLTERQAYLDRLQAVEAEKDRLPAQISQARRALDSFTPTSQAVLVTRLANADIATLGRELHEQLQMLEQLQDQLAQASNEQTFRQLLPERAQADITTLLTRMEDARAALIRLNVQDDALDNQAAVQRLRSEIALLDARLAWQRAELQGNTTRLTLAGLQAALLQQRIGDQEVVLDLIQNQLEDQRRAHARDVVQQAREPASGLPASRLLDTEARRNAQYAERIVAVTEQVNALSRDNVTLSSQLEQVYQLERSLVEQVAALQGSLLLSRILYQQQQMLPRLDPRAGKQLDLAALRLEQYQLDGQRDSLRNPAALAESLLDTSGETADTALRNALTQVLAARLTLVEELEPELGRLLNLGISHQAMQRQLLAASRTARATINEQLFWMPSSRPLTLDTLRALPATLPAQVEGLTSARPWQQAQARLYSHWPAPALALLLALALASRQRTLTRQLHAINEEVGYLKHDSQLHTPRALLLVLLQSLPLPLFLAVTGLTLRTDSTLGATLLGEVLLNIALIVLVFDALRRLLGRSEVAARRFLWPEQNIQALRRTLMLTGLVFVPVGLVIAVGERAPELLMDDQLGLLVMLLSGPLLSWLLARLSWQFPSGIKARSQFTRGATALALVSVPILLSVLSVIGYHYTAIRLGGRLVDTFYLLLAWTLMAASARRGLAVAARRLTYRRALARREEQNGPQDSETGDIIEEPPLNMAQVSAQTLRLTHLFLLLGFGIAIYLVWADLLGAMAYLDNIVLWQQVVGDGDQAMFVSTTLRDVVFAIVFLLVALMMARNLPGLLEVLVLSRLQLQPGSAYAITSMVAYTLTVVGLIVALGSIGVSWSKLQWLVAALGVGLGFGLQAIFSNFVSGIILLFERPIRIGDLITVSGVTGTVIRIRIRGTTIRDADRKEVIIPNQRFIQDQLVNWTLTDNMTRLVLAIGFAYGTDLERARQVLLQAAQENPRVLRDPAPAAFFLGFGASTLDHELRVHVGELSHRVPVQDELNRRIDALCREHDIEIAFNQLDVHIRTPEGQTLQFSPKDKGADV